MRRGQHESQFLALAGARDTVAVQLPSHVQLFATPWTVTRQTPLSIGFSRQEYWSRLPFPPPGDLPNPGIEPVSPALAGRYFTAEPSGKTQTALQFSPLGYAGTLHRGNPTTCPGVTQVCPGLRP